MRTYMTFDAIALTCPLVTQEHHVILFSMLFTVSDLYSESDISWLYIKAWSCYDQHSSLSMKMYLIYSCVWYYMYMYVSCTDTHASIMLYYIRKDIYATFVIVCEGEIIWLQRHNVVISKQYYCLYECMGYKCTH